MMTTKRSLVLMVLIALAANGSALATTKTWFGGSGIGAEWSKNGNWSPVGTPATGDDIIINSGHPEVDVTIFVNSITLNGTGITIDSGQILKSTTTTAFGTVGMSGSGTFVNDGSVTAFDSTLTFGSSLVLQDTSGSTWNADSTSSFSTLEFLKTTTSLLGDFHLADTNSTFEIVSGVNVVTTGSYFAPYAFKCDGIAGLGTFVWTGSGGFPAGHCN